MGDYILDNNQLYHHGILGMKWGIRRYQNRDGSLTPAGKQRLAEKQIRTEENLSEKTIPKGTKIYRATPNEKDSNASKSIYVTYLDTDRHMYRDGTIVNMYTDKKLNEREVYEHEFQLKTDVKIPSLKTVREIEKRVVADEKARQEVGRAWMESFLVTDQGATPKDLSVISEVEKLMSKATTGDERRAAYQKVCKKYGDDYGDFYWHEAKNIANGREWVNANDSFTIERSLGRAPNVKNSIIKELKKLGYNAMYDNASIGVGSNGEYSKQQEGVEPLIIFDSDNTLQKITTRRVNASERQASRDQYDQWIKDRNETLKNFK